MNLTMKSLVISAAAVGAALTFASRADAQYPVGTRVIPVSQGAWFGSPLFASDAPCFRETWGGVYNINCLSKPWRMQIPGWSESSFGSVPVTLWFNSSAGMTCYNDSCAANASSCITTSANVGNGNCQNNCVISMASPTYNYTGYQFVTCYVPTYATLGEVAWNMVF
jgi:hypothetical protein